MGVLRVCALRRTGGPSPGFGAFSSSPYTVAFVLGLGAQHRGIVELSQSVFRCVTVFACYSSSSSFDQVIRENPASRGTEASAEVLVGPPCRMESNAGQQQIVCSMYTFFQTGTDDERGTMKGSPGCHRYCAAAFEQLTPRFTIRGSRRRRLLGSCC